MARRIDPERWIILHIECEGETHRYACRQSNSISQTANEIWDAVHKNTFRNPGEQYTLALNGVPQLHDMKIGTPFAEGDTVAVIPLPSTEEG